MRAYWNLQKYTKPIILPNWDPNVLPVKHANLNFDHCWLDGPTAIYATCSQVRPLRSTGPILVTLLPRRYELLVLVFFKITCHALVQNCLFQQYNVTTCHTVILHLLKVTSNLILQFKPRPLKWSISSGNSK
jgi:hypothetical protein